MRAAVYRHLDTRSGLLGLSAVEWGPVLLVFWLGLVNERPNLGLAGAIALYLAAGAATRGRPDGFLQHWILWHLRQRASGGRLSAVARASAPRFPFASYAWRMQRRTDPAEVKP